MAVPPYLAVDMQDTKQKEIQDLERRLQEVSDSQREHRLQVTRLSVSAHYLQHKLFHLKRAEEDDNEDYDEERALSSGDDNDFHSVPGTLRGLEHSLMLCNEPYQYPPMEDLSSPRGPEEKLPVRTVSMEDSYRENPPQTGCRYSCFRAGPPLPLTVFNDIITMGCHWLRSREIENLSEGSLASDSEKRLLEAQLGWSEEKVNAQHSLINVMVWRRSVLLVLFLCSLATVGFAIVGDFWTTFTHMQTMGRMSDFVISYETWRYEELLHLGNVSCSRIDAHFKGVLESMSMNHNVKAHDCTNLYRIGLCEKTVDHAVEGCWEPGLCQEAIKDHCPSTCTGRESCWDTRDAKRVDFTAFTGAFAKSILYKLMAQVSYAQLQKQVISVLFKLVACLLMLRAATLWADWSKSNRLVLWAWLVMFSAPFLRSIIPTPRLINWDPIEADLEQYVQTVDHHFNLSPRMLKLADAAGMNCHDHKMETMVNETWRDTHGKVRWWCGKIDWGSRFFPWSHALEQGTKECQVLTNYMGIGDIATGEATIEKDQLCQAIHDSHMKQEPFSGVADILDVGWIKSAAYTLVGGLSSVLSFQVVLPEALSVAPGFLMGALRTKLVLPQSYLPGVFIVIMPLLYVPMAWAFCIFIVQGVGDWYMLVALILLVFSPLSYTILGLTRRVSSPMSRKNVRSFTTHVQNLVTLMMVMGFACILCYLYEIWDRIGRVERSQTGIAYFLLEQGKLMLPLLIGQVSFSLTSLALSGPFWSLNFTFWTEMYMTAVVSVDWMLRASAEEWSCQGCEYFAELKEQGKLDTVNAEHEHKARNEAMGAMVELTLPKSERKGGTLPEPFTGH
jgi:hypothetical protein